MTPSSAHSPKTVPGKSEHPRLSKRMGELGLCSRREADRWIESGWVKVDGQVVDTLGVRVSPNARIEIDRAARDHQSGQVTILLHKPVGYVSGQAEDGYEPAIVLIRPENRWAADPSPIQFQRGHLRGARPRRPTGHRLHRAAGAHPGWTRREAADRRELLGREGIPRAGRRQPLSRWHEAPAVRPDARWREAEARAGVLAERYTSCASYFARAASARSAACASSWVFS